MCIYRPRMCRRFTSSSEAAACVLSAHLPWSLCSPLCTTHNAVLLLASVAWIIHRANSCTVLTRLISPAHLGHFYPLLREFHPGFPVSLAPPPPIKYLATVDGGAGSVLGVSLVLHMSALSLHIRDDQTTNGLRSLQGQSFAADLLLSNLKQNGSKLKLQSLTIT